MNRKLAALLLILPLALTACNVGGSGWVPSTSGSGEATFGFHGRCYTDKDGNDHAVGRLRYVDTLPDGSTLRLNGKLAPGPCQSGGFLVFTGEYGSPKNGSGGGLLVMLLDTAGDGPSAGDWFLISVSGGAHSGYAHTGVVGGGTTR